MSETGTLNALSELWSSAFVLPAAGALAAFVVVLAGLALRGSHAGGFTRALVALACVVLLAATGFTLWRQAAPDGAAENDSALLARNAELNRSALAPGSALACVDAGAGEAVENACEERIFATPQSTAGAVAYMDARLALLAAAAGHDNPAVKSALAASRRAVSLDRYGIAAHVLATRDGCSPAACAVFALVDDASALKANLKAEVFDQYVSRYAARWNAPPPVEKPPPAVAQTPVPGPRVVGGVTTMPSVKPGEPWDFPTADSIPAVSIMNKEPPLPKNAEAAAGAAPAMAAAPATSTHAAAPTTGAATPVPPKRPPQAQNNHQPQAAPPPTQLH
jgi:hypothetical protein